MRKRGASLVELILAVGVFAVMMVSLAYITKRGYDFFWESSGSLDVQKAALVGTRLMAQDLKRSSIESVRVFPDSEPPDTETGGPFDGIVFASPQDLDGEKRFSQRGQTIWQTYLGYSASDMEGGKTMIRRQLPITNPGIVVPVPERDGVDLNVLEDSDNAKVIVTGLRKLQFTKEEHLVKVEMTAGLKRRGLFTITIRNQMFPAN